MQRSFPEHVRVFVLYLHALIPSKMEKQQKHQRPQQPFFASIDCRTPDPEASQHRDSSICVSAFLSPVRGNTMSLSSSLAAEQLHALLLTEQSYVVPHVPCRLQRNKQHHRPINELDEWRRKICQWSYRVIDHFRL
jgi:hypothetical protein